MFVSILCAVLILAFAWAMFVLPLHRRIVSKDRALEAVLLFYHGGTWGKESREKWLELTGTEEATTVNLCKCVRAAYGRQYYDNYDK